MYWVGKNMNERFISGIILAVMALSIGYSFVSLASVVTLQVISPQYGQVFHYGQELVVQAKTNPNEPFDIYLVTPSGSSIPINASATGSSGMIVQFIGYFGSGSLATPGKYVVDINVNSGQANATIPIYYKPFVATIVAQVQNEQHLPVSGAMVYLYNTTAGIHSLITMAMTNSTGLAVFQVTAFNFTQDFQVVAAEAGYVNASASVSVLENQTKTVTLTLYPAVLNVYVVAATQNGMVVNPLNPAGYSSLVATEGENVTVYIETLFAGMQVTNATVTVMVTTPIGTPKMYTATPVTSGTYMGYYMVSFMLPPTNVSYDALMNITATYSSLSETIYVPIAAQVNYTALINSYVNTLKSEIEALNSTVYTLKSEISSLNTSITTLESELSTITNETTILQSSVKSLQSSISSLNGTVSSLNSEVSSLSSQVSSFRSQLSSLNSTVSSLNSKLSGITPLVYGGLIAGIIGLIVAIVAIVLVYRKIS